MIILDTYYLFILYRKRYIEAMSAFFLVLANKGNSVKKIVVMFLFVIGSVYTKQTIDYMRDSVLSSLAQWPEQKPNVTEDHHSMFFNQGQLAALLNNETKLVIELGSWLGGSIRFICQNAPNAIVIAIDHWQGSPEHFENPDCQKRIPTLYETFLVNCWEYKNRLIPLQASTIEGLEKVKAAGLNPDIVYVDAAHDYDSATRDIEKVYELFPKTCICGDDWQWNASAGLPVQRAVRDFAARHNFTIHAERNFWRLQKNR